MAASRGSIRPTSSRKYDDLIRGLPGRHGPLGPRSATSQMGASVYELPADRASPVPTYEYPEEEWLFVLSGRVTLVIRTAKRSWARATSSALTWARGRSQGHVRRTETARVTTTSTKQIAGDRGLSGQRQGLGVPGRPRSPDRCAATRSTLGRRGLGVLRGDGQLERGSRQQRPERLGLEKLSWRPPSARPSSAKIARVRRRRLRPRATPRRAVAELVVRVGASKSLRRRCGDLSRSSGTPETEGEVEAAAGLHALELRAEAEGDGGATVAPVLADAERGCPSRRWPALAASTLATAARRALRSPMTERSQEIELLGKVEGQRAAGTIASTSVSGRRSTSTSRDRLPAPNVGERVESLFLDGLPRGSAMAAEATR